jgi:hypothetical protein
VANFRVENPLNEKADIILELRLDPEAKKILEVARVTGVPLGQPITLEPGDCPLLAQIEFIPNGELPVGSRGLIDVAARAFSRKFPEGIELSGVVFDYQTVAPGLQTAYSCARHRDAGEIRLPLALAGRPTSDPRREVKRIKAIFNVPLKPPKGVAINDAIRISSVGGSQIPEFEAFFTDKADFGTELTIDFREALPGRERYSFNFGAFVDLDEDPLTGDSDFELRVLQGDANSSGAVTATDISFVRGRINREVEFGPTSRADGNQTGTITATDISYVRGRIGSSAP